MPLSPKEMERQQQETLGTIIEYIPINEAVEEVYREIGRPKGSDKFDRMKKMQFCALLLTGVSEPSAAYACGITTRTVRTHKKEDAEFAANVEAAQARALRGAEQSLYSLVLRGNLSAIKYWLNNRYPEFYQDRKPPVDPIDESVEDSKGFNPNRADIMEALDTIGVAVLGTGGESGVGEGGTSSEDSGPVEPATDS